MFSLSALTIEDAKEAGDTRLVALLTVLDRIAQEQSVSRTAVALAWLLVHPAGVIPIIGTQTLSRIEDSISSLDVELSRSQWNEILVAAQGFPLP